MSLDQLQAIVSICVGLLALGGGIGLWRRMGAMKAVTDKELRSNGGGSLVDRVLRICDWQPKIDDKLDGLDNRLRSLEGSVQSNVGKLERLDTAIEENAVRHKENVDRLVRIDAGMDVLAEGQTSQAKRLSDLQHEFNNVRAGKQPPDEPTGSSWSRREPEPPKSPGRF